MGSQSRSVDVEPAATRWVRLREAVDAAVERQFDSLVELRRHLHQHPEPSGEEQQTTLHLYQLLGALGCQVRMGPDGCGVIADLRRASRESQGSAAQGSEDRTPVRSGPAEKLALRADIDALRIHDLKQVTYRSQVEGVMHACGHDAHTAIVYGVVAALCDLEQQGLLAEFGVDVSRVRAIFQPAEETCSGARDMIRVGVLEGVQAILACHMDPSRELGRIGLRSGVLTANCDEVAVTIRGRGGHAARPHEASDPIAAAAQFINALYMFVPRTTDSQDAVVVTIGQITGGETANVIPEQVLLRGTIRTLDDATRQRTFSSVLRLAEGVSRSSETRIDVQFGTSCDSVRNSPELVSLLEREAGDLLGPGGVQEIPRPSMGSEDFAFYLGEVPGAMFRLGCRSEATGGAPLHSPSFDVAEQSLGLGARLLARAALAWLAGPLFSPPHPTNHPAS